MIPSNMLCRFVGCQIKQLGPTGSRQICVAPTALPGPLDASVYDKFVECQKSRETPGCKGTILTVLLQTGCNPECLDDLGQKTPRGQKCTAAAGAECASTSVPCSDEGLAPNPTPGEMSFSPTSADVAEGPSGLVNDEGGMLFASPLCQCIAFKQLS
jgi:hypothetical protein